MGVTRILTVLMACLVSQMALGAPAIKHDIDQLQTYRDRYLSIQVEDIKVKVRGGHLRQTRHWNDGRWEFNQRWRGLGLNNFGLGEVTVGNALAYRGHTEAEPPVSIIGAESIYRGNTRYDRQEGNDNIYYRYIGETSRYRRVVHSQNHPDYRPPELIVHSSSRYDNLEYIVAGESGLTWRNARGDSISYDQYGRIMAYGREGYNEVYFNYDSNGLIRSANDRNDNEVFLFEYIEANVEGEEGVYLPLSVTDYTGRRVSYSYDTSYNMTAVYDVLENAWQYEYDNDGGLKSIIDPEERKTVVVNGTDGELVSITSADGATTRFNFTGTGEQYKTIVRHPGGRVVETQYNELGMVARRVVNGNLDFATTCFLETGTEVKISEVGGRAELPGVAQNTSSSAPSPGGARLDYCERKDAHGEILTSWYDSRRNIIRRKRASDGAEQTTHWHPTYPQRIRNVDWGGTISTWEYDDQGMLIRQVLAADTPDEQVTKYTYDNNGQLLSIVYSGSSDTPDGRYIYDYDDYGNRIRITGPGEEVTAFVHQEYGAFDVLGNATVHVDARGHATRYHYDAAGNLLTETNPLGHVAEHHYNHAGDRIGITWPNGAASHWDVDSAGRPLSITDALEHTTAFEYDDSGRMVSVKLPSGASTQNRYDINGRLVMSADASGNVSRYHYEGERLNAVEYPSYREDHTLDTMGRVTRTELSSELGEISQTRRLGYDTAGNLIRELDAEGLETATAYDALQRPIRIVDAAGGVTQLGYDARNNLIRVTDPEGSTTAFTYDAHGRLLRETRPGGETRHYTYYPGGLRESEINGEGQITHYGYDEVGQLTTVRYYANQQALTNVQPGRTVTFTYNDLGLLSGYQDHQSGSLASSASYGYDLLGRLTETTVNYGPFSKTHSYTYDQDGRKATYTNPEGVTYTYAWTPDGDFQSLTLPGEGTIAVTEYQWRTPIETLYPGGTRIRHDVDGLLRPGETQLLDAANTPHARRNYQYNLENHITRIDSETGEHLYTYDQLYRLVRAQFGEELGLNDEAYTYDGVANRLTENGEGPWQYNENHQLLSKPGASFEYDANGHTIRKTEQDGTVTLYEYDLAERLRQVRIENGPVLGSYHYDPFGRRISKTTQQGTIYFHYDDTGLLAEYDVNSNLIAEYHYWPSSTWMTNPLFKREGATGTLHYYYNGHLGQPLKLFSRSGEVAWSAEWQAFGYVHVLTILTTNNLRYPGQYWDEEIEGLYNYKRFYLSSLGRYLEADPVKMGGGINYYSYASQNPVSYVDFNGLRSAQGMRNPRNGRHQNKPKKTGRPLTQQQLDQLGQPPSDPLGEALSGVFDNLNSINSLTDDIACIGMAYRIDSDFNERILRYRQQVSRCDDVYWRIEMMNVGGCIGLAYLFIGKTPSVHSNRVSGIGDGWVMGYGQDKGLKEDACCAEL